MFDSVSRFTNAYQDITVRLNPKYRWQSAGFGNVFKMHVWDSEANCIATECRISVAVFIVDGVMGYKVSVRNGEDVGDDVLPPSDTSFKRNLMFLQNLWDSNRSTSFHLSEFFE